MNFEKYNSFVYIFIVLLKPCTFYSGVRAHSISQKWQAGTVVLNVKCAILAHFTFKSYEFTTALYNISIYASTDLKGEIWLTTEFCYRICLSEYACSDFVYFEKLAKLFKIVIFNPFQSFPSSAILVPFKNQPFGVFLPEQTIIFGFPST